MKNLFDRTSAVKSSSASSSSSFDHKLSPLSSTRASSLLYGIVVSAFSVFERRGERKGVGFRCYGNGWGATVKRVMASGSIWRIKEQMMGYGKSSVVTSSSDIWLLGVCYKLDETSGGDPAGSARFAAFVEDFSSRILMTYRKGIECLSTVDFT